MRHHHALYGRPTGSPSGVRPRRGSTLIVVLALLALLSVIGLSFVTFSGSARTSAENFAAAAESRTIAEPRPSTGVLTRFAARRIIIGPHNEDKNKNGVLDPGEDTNGNGMLDAEANSAMSGGRHTFLGTLFGGDIHPHSGRGVHLIEYVLSGGQRTGFPLVDQDYNGQADGSSALLEINDSRSASLNGSIPSRPAPDVDYTAADINSVFLGYQGLALGPDNRPVFVIIPSFCRPQYLRTFSAGRTHPRLEWETDASTARQVLRPHPLHKDYGPNGQHRTSSLDPLGLRYVVTKAEANRLGLSGPFPFSRNEDNNKNGVLDPGEDTNGNGMLDAEAHHGVWTLGRWQPNSYYRVGQWVLVSEDADGDNVLDSGEDTIVSNSQLDRRYFRVINAGLTGNNPPSFAVAVGGTVSGGGTAPIWRRFATFQARYEFDADADADGIKEAVWIDLDFPAVPLGNGRKAIPLFAITILGADGLINLNAAGNTHGAINIGGNPFGGGGLISRSNLGVSPSEINPLWALNAGSLLSDFPSIGRTREEVFQDHFSFFGHYPSADPANWFENANMEWWFATKGRPVRQPGSGSIITYVTGRHGDLTRLIAAVQANSNNATAYPRPGLPGVDDNRNGDQGEQAPPFDSNNLAAERPYVHPMDFLGSGTFTIKTSNLYQPQRYASGKNRFLQYQGYQAQQSTNPGTSVRWSQALGGVLMQQSRQQPVIDEEVESVVDERNRQAADRLFMPPENFFLQASRSDLEASGIDSRAANLFAYNFKINNRSDSIRGRFTADSWDTRDFPRPFHGVVNGLDRRRAWEFSATGETNRYGTATYRFPPRFPGAEIGNDNDPFRPSLRKLLQVIANSAPDYATDSTRVQRKLSPNDLIDTINGVVQYRSLTAHPFNPGTSLVPTGWNKNNRPNYPPSTPTEKEWWARFDRQRMARDIYVLLYTLCGGSDVHNYTKTNDHADTMTDSDPQDYVYTTEQLREMAQFAVNCVDAMDRDNVITRFEYDKNLGPTIDGDASQVLRSGWNLDGNAWTPDGFSPNNVDAFYPDDSIERGVVYGVEAQQLTLSEFFAVRTVQVTKKDDSDEPYNHPATAHDDREKHVYAYIELRNASPHDLSLAGGHWRIVLKPGFAADDDDDDDDDRKEVRRLTFRGNLIVGGGELLTVGSCSDDHNINGGGSRLLVDPDYDPETTNQPNFLQIAPSGAVGSGNFLDLITQASSSAFRISDGDGLDLTATLGALLSGRTFKSDQLSVKIILQRRLHPDRTTLDTAGYDLDNPWIEVDRSLYLRSQKQWEFRIAEKDNELASSGETHGLRKELWDLRSRERPEPLHRNLGDNSGYVANPAGTSGSAPWRLAPRTSLRLNSLGTDNGNSPAEFQLWQAHFDREFASLIDLFDVPIYAPHQLTNSLDRKGTYTAGRYKFLNPRPTNGEARFNNRWIRLLSFLEIPTRTDRFVNGVLPDHRKYRIPGKINLNDIRHPEVFAGLLDQPDAFKPMPGTDNEYLRDLSGELVTGDPIRGRDWWSQFLISRDRYDPVSECYLPAMAHGRPFRSTGLTRFGAEGIEHSILRSIPLDTNTSTGYVKRRLFQLGTQNQHNNDSVDHHTRHRLLAKIHGNTTTRSHVFFVWVKVDWFEAHQDPSTGHTRIGAKLKNAHSSRSFLVVDRSRALELLQPEHIPSDGSYRVGTGSSNNNQDLDPETMILYQQILE